jgi:hypothetical protein
VRSDMAPGTTTGGPPLADPLAADTPAPNTPPTRAFASRTDGRGGPGFSRFHLRHTTLRGIDPASSGSYRQGAEPNLTLRDGVGGGT